MKGNTNGRHEQTQTTGYPLVGLVDLDGFRVGVGEKDIPDVTRTPVPADAWPARTDLVRVHVGGRDHDEHAFGVIVGDVARTVLARADAANDELDVESGCEPLPDPAELADWRTVEDWPDAPDASPFARFPGAPTLAERRALPPIAGGSEEAEPFEPSPEDWRDYCDWSRRQDPLYGSE
jgi:hypothetical protein